MLVVAVLTRAMAPAIHAPPHACMRMVMCGMDYCLWFGGAISNDVGSSQAVADCRGDVVTILATRIGDLDEAQSCKLPAQQGVQLVSQHATLVEVAWLDLCSA